MYGAEEREVERAQENKLEVAEMGMLRWMCGVTKLNMIRNKEIRGIMKVGEISKKRQEMRLKWYEHAMRREEPYVGHYNIDGLGHKPSNSEFSTKFIFPQNDT